MKEINLLDLATVRNSVGLNDLTPTTLQSIKTAIAGIPLSSAVEWSVTAAICSVRTHIEHNPEVTNTELSTLKVMAELFSWMDAKNFGPVKFSELFVKHYIEEQTGVTVTLKEGSNDMLKVLQVVWPNGFIHYFDSLHGEWHHRGEGCIGGVMFMLVSKYHIPTATVKIPPGLFPVSR